VVIGQGGQKSVCDRAVHVEPIRHLLHRHPLRSGGHHLQSPDTPIKGL